MGVSTAPEQRRCGRSRGGGWAPLDVEGAAPAASVAVMAPALTESGPQKPENLLPPLPAGGFLSAQQATQVCQNREVLAKFVVSASVQPSKIDEQCLRGIPKDLIRDVINSSKYSNGLDSLSTFGKNGGDTDDLISGSAAAAATGGGGECEVAEDIDADEVGALGGFVESRKLTLSSSSSSNSSNTFGFSLSSPRHKTNNCNSLFTSLDNSPRAVVSKPDAIEATKPEQPERSFIMSSDLSAGQRTDLEMCFIETSTGADATTTTTTTTPATSTTTPQKYNLLASAEMAITEEPSGGGETSLQDPEPLSQVPSSVLSSLGSADLPSVGDVDEDDDKDDHLDRLIGTFASEDLPPGVPHMGHNVEDILQVIKSMEGAAESVAGVASEQPQGVEMFPITEGFSSFERDLLSEVDVDVMSSLCTDNISIGNMDPVESEPQRINANLRTLQDNAEQRQFESERRSAFLLRRLRKLQARLVGRHVAEETTGVLELAHHSVKKFFYQELANIEPKSGGAREYSEIGDSLSAFLAKIEKSCSVQSKSVSNRQRVVCRYFGGGSRDNAVAAAVATASGGSANAAAATAVATSRIPISPSKQIKLDSQEVENVAGSLAKQLRLVEGHLDSDCTASSSGGESCDEMQLFNNSHQQTLPISKRASWRWAQERASIASRWTWLQGQISDLEYKIRQHNELQRQMRSAKGLVLLENTDAVNGYSGVLPGSTGRSNMSEAAAEPPASRTRPFAWDIYRKRKLLQVDRLHEFSKRAARPSTVRCDCDHILAACALCTGRSDPTQPQEPIELLSVPERLARVDPSYHPVLSFPDDIPAGTHFESIMKTVDWQQKMLRGNHRMTRVKDKDSGTERRSKKQQQQQQSQPDNRPKYTSRIKKSSSTILTARIKRKMLKGKRERSGQGRANTGNIQGLSGSATGGSRKRAAKVAPQQPEVEDDTSLLSISSKHSSPVPSPLQHQHNTTTAVTEKISVKEKASNPHGRLRQNSYDIDNIVIPYSVAASTRLEKLQYKEILTPKWRLCEETSKMDVKNGVVHKPSQDSDIEDVSEEAIALRHERSEREENKRFMTYVNMPHQGRIRHNRRADSRADSGANTPDPMSPHASEFGGDVTSPITSPPATPACVTQDTDQNHQQQQQQQQHNANLDSHRGSSLQNAIRRRTISTMRLVKEDTASSFAEDEHEIPPYDPRTFPLAEEVYDKMLQVMPDGHWQPSTESICSKEEEKPDDQEAEMESPESDSTESACCDVEGEDPNDPEWTVADDRDTEKERIRPTAKR